MRPKIGRLNRKSGQTASLTQLLKIPGRFSKNGNHYSILKHLN